MHSKAGQLMSGEMTYIACMFHNVCHVKLSAGENTQCKQEFCHIVNESSISPLKDPSIYLRHMQWLLLRQ